MTKDDATIIAMNHPAVKEVNIEDGEIGRVTICVDLNDHNDWDETEVEEELIEMFRNLTPAGIEFSFGAKNE